MRTGRAGQASARAASGNIAGNDSNERRSMCSVLPRAAGYSVRNSPSSAQAALLERATTEAAIRLLKQLQRCRPLAMSPPSSGFGIEVLHSGRLDSLMLIRVLEGHPLCKDWVAYQAIAPALAEAVI